MNTYRYLKIINSVLLCMLVLQAPGRTQVAQTPQIVQELRTKYGKDVTLQTTFDLHILWKVREKTEEKRGTLYIAPRDKFRLELDKSVWVSDGRTYWQYSTATNQVVIKQLLDIDLSMHPSQIITTYLYDHDYTVAEENDKEAVLRWQAPNDGTKAYAKAIRIWVDKKKMLLRKLWVEDTNGNESTYIFKKTKAGSDIPSSVFTFVPPEGASVLDTRE